MTLTNVYQFYLITMNVINLLMRILFFQCIAMSGADLNGGSGVPLAEDVHDHPTGSDVVRGAGVVA